MAATLEVTPEALAAASDEQKLEWLRYDLPFLAENLLKIGNKSGQRQKLSFKPEQRRFWRAMRDQRDRGLPMRVLSLKARQVGISTATQAAMIQRVTQFSDHRALVLAQEHGTAGQLF